MRKLLAVLFTLMIISGCSSVRQSSPPVSEHISAFDRVLDCNCVYNYTGAHSGETIAHLKAVAEDNYIYSLMSSNAYDDKPQVDLPGWRRVHRYDTWKGFGADVYLSADEKKVAIAFRGTDGPSMADWFWGNLNFYWRGQYGDADELFDNVRNQYQGKKIIATGHSLGGGLAMHIAIVNDGVDAIVFDPSPRVFANHQYDKYENSITVISEKGEILKIARDLFTTLKKIRPQTFQYNYLSGNPVKEHSMMAFAKCMFKTAQLPVEVFAQQCKTKK